uniref:7TM_GPCR_Srx domain-containing protein n=1 Tax=Elaeophora elaphi TaxID=1147741 RepID=A0A0R3RHI9_9BILA
MQWIDLLQYLPICLILITLTFLGLNHLCFTSLISPANFQQLTMLGISCIIFDGVSNHLYHFFDIIISRDYLSFDSWTAFYLGILNGLHFLIASPLLYQQYFSLSSRQRLRESLATHVGLFGLLTSVIILSPNLFANAFNWFCPTSLFPFVIVNKEKISEEVSNGLLRSLITAVLSLIASFGIILTELSLINLIWEDLLRPWLIRRPSRLQIGLLIIGSIIIAVSNLWLYLDRPLRHGPISLTLAAPMTALYICSYLFPFLNGRGATTGLLTGIFGALILLYLYFGVTPLRFHHFPRPCFNGTSILHPIIWPNYKFKNAQLDFIPTALQALNNKAKTLLPILCEIPIAWYPLATFATATLSMLLVSLCTSTDNFDGFDWKLIVCAPYIKTFKRQNNNGISTDKRFAFANCESFRCAQETPYPDTSIAASHIYDGYHGFLLSHTVNS